MGSLAFSVAELQDKAIEGVFHNLSFGIELLVVEVVAQDSPDLTMTILLMRQEKAVTASTSSGQTWQDLVIAVFLAVAAVAAQFEDLTETHLKVETQD